MNELKIASACQHQNVVTFIRSLESPSHFGLVFDFMEGGDLTSRIKGRKALDFVRTAKDVMEGMAFLHSRHIIHRDLKSDNVLFDASGTAKLSDFGASRITSFNTARQELTGEVGSYLYMAPEVICKNLPSDVTSKVPVPADDAASKKSTEAAERLVGGIINSSRRKSKLDRMKTPPLTWFSKQKQTPLLHPNTNAHSTATGYTSKVDVYSFAIMLWEMAHKETAWGNLQPIPVAMGVVAGKRPGIDPGMPPCLLKILNSSWANDPDARPDFPRLLSEFLPQLNACTASERAALNSYRTAVGAPTAAVPVSYSVVKPNFDN
jgi:serine/threonine protein kinase